MADTNIAEIARSLTPAQREFIATPTATALFGSDTRTMEGGAQHAMAGRLHARGLVTVPYSYADAVFVTDLGRKVAAYLSR